jgi:hypothetical protein
MDLDRFLTSLQHLGSDAIAAAAAELDDAANSVAGEVSWWRATVEIDRQLRAHHAARRGAIAATQAANAVVRAAAAVGLPTSDHRVTVVARAAADVARGLVVEASAADDLLQGCRALVAA